MINVEVSEIINRPVKEVFAYIRDNRHDVLWQDGLLEVHLTPDKPIEVGSQIHEVRKFMGRRIESTSIVTDLEPDKKIYRKTLQGVGEVEGFWGFEPVEGGTRVTQHFEMRPGGFMAVMEPMMAPALRRTFLKNLGDLKDLLEGKVPAEA